MLRKSVLCLEGKMMGQPTVPPIPFPPMECWHKWLPLLHLCKTHHHPLLIFLYKWPLAGQNSVIQSVAPASWVRRPVKWWHSKRGNIVRCIVLIWFCGVLDSSLFGSVQSYISFSIVFSRETNTALWYVCTYYGIRPFHFIILLHLNAHMEHLEWTQLKMKTSFSWNLRNDWVDVTYLRHE